MTSLFFIALVSLLFIRLEMSHAAPTLLTAAESPDVTPEVSPDMSKPQPSSESLSLRAPECLTRGMMLAVYAYERLNLRHSSQVECFSRAKYRLLSVLPHRCVTVRDVWTVKEGCKPRCLALAAIYAVADYENKRLIMEDKFAAATCLVREGLATYVLEPFGCRASNQEIECAKCVRIQDIWKAKQLCVQTHIKEAEESDTPPPREESK